jgi:hypothetical protein
MSATKASRRRLAVDIKGVMASYQYVMGKDFETYAADHHINSAAIRAVHLRDARSMISKLIELEEQS